jgi:hypothetical protein
LNRLVPVFQPLALARLLRGGGRGSGLAAWCRPTDRWQATVTCTAAVGPSPVRLLQCNQGVVRQTGGSRNTDLVL